MRELNRNEHGLAHEDGRMGKAVKGSADAVRLMDVYPLKAQFRSGERVRLAVQLANPGSAKRKVSLTVTIWELDREAERQRLETFVLPANNSALIEVEVGPFETDFTGYGAQAQLCENGEVIDSAGTAFDVVKDWRVSPRYGFLSEFGSEEAGDRADIEWMNKLHLNLVQFYDWMYKHDDLVSDEEVYTDLMGREVSRRVVSEKIALCHEHGMKAIAYGAVYAASRGFAELHPDWRLYTSAGDPFDFIGIFNIMNIAPDSPWSEHIVAEYRRTVEKLDFDGIHMDTYGFPKTGWSRLGGKERLERLEEQFAPLIEATREELTTVKEDICLIFNNVGNWPLDTVARASQDAIYVEVWKPYERYAHLRDIIGWARHSSGGKPVILAAYLKSFREPGSLGAEGAEHGFRLLNAVVTAHGGYHLLHGEEGGALTQGYYVDHSKLRETFLRTVRDYADFGVRYGHVLHAPELRDVSMTHAEGDNLEYAFEGFAYSTYGEAGKVWTIIRESAEWKLISFVNLMSASDDYWNEEKEAAAPVEGRLARIAFDGEIESVLLASPDAFGGGAAGSASPDAFGGEAVESSSMRAEVGGAVVSASQEAEVGRAAVSASMGAEVGRAIELPYEVEYTPRGKTAIIELPPLMYWDVLMVRMKREI
ncbi:glycoside hydrolase family 66 protein [Paenibacillus sp. HB172176]|uniref:glycoside hydrolase family 66 protein n=1 Tax=Paenibacillus sp. HB172176 TaxID=2493690 RepID=UPI001439885E|nr:glycoside hydrolase family 66 protein [Paenibacillus sp. HB172176]